MGADSGSFTTLFAQRISPVVYDRVFAPIVHYWASSSRPRLSRGRDEEAISRVDASPVVNHGASTAFGGNGRKRP